MSLVFAYLAGLLTLLNPCIVPILPIIITTALEDDKRGPLVLALGLLISFVAFGMTIPLIVALFSISENMVSTVSNLVLICLGITLIVPKFSNFFELIFLIPSNKANQLIQSNKKMGVFNQFISGLLIGIVWSPCVGPTLGAAISFAAQSTNLIWSFSIMVFFALGVSTIILLFGFGGQKILHKNSNITIFLTKNSRFISGLIFITIGSILLFKLNHILEKWAVLYLPFWLQDLSVSI